METTRIYLNYLTRDEGFRLALIALPFLKRGGEEGKRELITASNNLYGADKKLDFGWDNGRYPDGYAVAKGDKHYITLIKSEKRDMTQEALDLLGSTDNTNFPYHYAIMLGREDRLLYVASFSDRYCPNWTNKYDMEHLMPIWDVTIPLLKEDAPICMMDDALHEELNRRLADGQPMSGESVGYAWFKVHDQHGNYTDVGGETMERAFRSYADNYTGYQSFRKPMASEWVICDPKVRERYNDWRKTAKGLKSDFDKFYGGAVVD